MIALTSGLVECAGVSQVMQSLYILSPVSRMPLEVVASF